MSELFVFVRYFGGAYLIWTGVGLWQEKSDT